MQTDTLYSPEKKSDGLGRPALETVCRARTWVSEELSSTREKACIPEKFTLAATGTSGSLGP